MINKRLEALCGIVTEAHTLIQRDFKRINPVVGVSQKMRNVGIPADALTIDCLSSNKRIIIVLHDEQPGTINYQLSFKDKDPSEKFEKIYSADLTSNVIYSLIESYFSCSSK